MANLSKTLVILYVLFTCATARFSSVSDYEDQFQGSRNNKQDDDENKPLLFPRFGFPFEFPLFGGHERWKGEELPPENDNEQGITENLGSWEIHSENAGVSAMHIQLMPNNKAVWYDTTTLGLSEMKSDPPTCKPRVGGRHTDPNQDCTAHAIEYDVDTSQIRTLKLATDPWCSSGALSPKGALISTGGNQEGFRSVRILEQCEDCDFRENENALFSNRWYATQHSLENGSFVVVGGRGAYNYEIIAPDQLEFTTTLFGLPMLDETNEMGENNLYPFVNLLPDGNLFVFANYKSIILNPYTGETIRHLPDLPGGSRSYPPSGMSALLPINLNEIEPDVEVIVCGGNTRDSYIYSDLKRPRKFFPAFKDCGRLNLNKEGSKWVKEDMPSPRVMGTMLLLPNGEVLISNGAKAGTSAWNSADIPNLTPVLYSPNKNKGQRFKELTPSNIPRMYHSVSAVLPDGKILVAGSNTNPFYMFDKAVDPDVIYPTDLRVEKFSPPYFAPELRKHLLNIDEDRSEKKLNYGYEFTLHIASGARKIDRSAIKVTMYSPPFTTHGYSMNQRLLILKLKKVSNKKITVVAPQSGKLAPPGYYLLFVVHHDVPSRGMWVHVD